ncbi:MAG: hypothetical protein LUI39_05320 [Lachnospiraceae bacterium]|nr:hypothetical protein [Lachnospiraceae bacterium]
MMKNKLMAIATAICMTAMISVTVLPVSAADSHWFPDINTAFGAEGEYTLTATGEDGITYDAYTYNFDSTIEDISSGIVAYSESVKELGYDVSTLKCTGTQYRAMAYEIDGLRVEFALYLSEYDGDGSLDADEVASWKIILVVPQDLDFTLGCGASDVVDGQSVCAGCGGTGICSGCGGSGHIGLFLSRETCPNCNGNGICSVCEGEGSY